MLIATVSFTTLKSPLLLDPLGDVVHNILGNVARTRVVGVARGTCAFQEEVIEFGVALKANVGPFGERVLPITEGVHRYIVITLALEDEQRLFVLERIGGRKVAAQIEPIAGRAAEQEFFVVAGGVGRCELLDARRLSL